MKKLITTAALLAAGTAFANAITLVADYKFDGNLTNSVSEGAIGGALTDTWGTTNYVDRDGGQALELTTRTTGSAYAGIYNGTTGAYSSVGDKWALSLDIKLVELSGSYQTVIKFGNGETSGSYGYQLVVGNGANDWGSGVGFTAANSYGNRAMSTQSISTGDWNTLTLISMGSDSAIQLYLNGDNITSTLTNTDGDGISGLSNTFTSEMLKIGYNNACGGTGFSLKDGTQLDNLKLWTLSDTDTLESVVAVVIPEPSAFGLLAGAGALALVASRRRRSRKA